MSWEMGRERKTLNLSLCRRRHRRCPLLPAHTRVTTYNANHANSPRKNSGDTNVMTEPAAQTRQDLNVAGKKEVRASDEAHTLTHRLTDGLTD